TETIDDSLDHIGLHQGAVVRNGRRRGGKLNRCDGHPLAERDGGEIDFKPPRRLAQHTSDLTRQIQPRPAPESEIGQIPVQPIAFEGFPDLGDPDVGTEFEYLLNRQITVGMMVVNDLSTDRKSSFFTIYRLTRTVNFL